MAAVDDASNRPAYNTAAVVRRTGVPATTFRAWERRYGFPKPQRDVGGQRLYSERDIQAIRWLTAQTDAGVAISRAIALLREGHAGPPEPVSRTASPRSFESLCHELSATLLALDPVRAEAVLAEAFALYAVEEVCLQLLQPVLVEVGDRWHAGEVSVAQEHFASAFVRARLSALLHAAPRPSASAPLILAATAPNEWHELGLLLVCVFLARQGFNVRFLGANLPLDALLDVAAQQQPALVILSAQSRERARGLVEAANRLREGRAPRPRLAVGGQAFNADPALHAALGPDVAYLGPDAQAAVAQVAEVLGGVPGRRASDGQRGG